jgi:hypothetical protein
MADGEQQESELRTGAQGDMAAAQNVTVLAERPKNAEIESKGEIKEELVDDVKGKAPEDGIPEEPKPQSGVDDIQSEKPTVSRIAKMELLALPYDLKSLILSYVSLSAPSSGIGTDSSICLDHTSDRYEESLPGE